MPGATAATLLKMDQKENAVRVALEKAERAAEVVDGESIAATVASAFSPVLFFLPAAMRTDAQEAAAGNIRAARQRFNQWADGATEEGWKRRALNGLNPQGYTYPAAITFWLGIGDDLLSELGVHVEALDTGSTAAVVKNTATQTATDVGNLATGQSLPEFWPQAWKDRLRKAGWAAAAVGGVVVLVWGAVELAPLLALTKKKAEG